MREEDSSQRRASPKTPSDARKPGIYFCNYPFSSAILRLLYPVIYWEQPIGRRTPLAYKTFLGFYTKFYACLSSGIALFSVVHTSVDWTCGKSHLAWCDPSRESIFEIATSPASCEERTSNEGNVFLVHLWAWRLVWVWVLYGLMREWMLKRASTHVVHHLLSMTAAITWYRLATSLRLQCPLLQDDVVQALCLLGFDTFSWHLWVTGGPE